MFYEERLDPHGVGNLPYVLTVKNKSSTFGVRRETSAEIRPDSLSRLASSPLNFALAVSLRALVLQRERARRLHIFKQSHSYGRDLSNDFINVPV